MMSIQEMFLWLVIANMTGNILMQVATVLGRTIVKMCSNSCNPCCKGK